MRDCDDKWGANSSQSVQFAGVYRKFAANGVVILLQSRTSPLHIEPDRGLKHLSVALFFIVASLDIYEA
jgi:hypothetical protein